MFSKFSKNIQGQTLVEFALIFPIILLIILGIIEFSLFANANSLVNYAAFVAARGPGSRHGRGLPLQVADSGTHGALRGEDLDESVR